LTIYRSFHRRLLEPIGDVPPAEFEATHNRKGTLNEDLDKDAGPILPSLR
jgi:hypothetical protein